MTPEERKRLSEELAREIGGRTAPGPPPTQPPVSATFHNNNQVVINAPPVHSPKRRRGGLGLWLFFGVLGWLVATGVLMVKYWPQVAQLDGMIDRGDIGSLGLRFQNLVVCTWILMKECWWYGVLAGLIAYFPILWFWGWLTRLLGAADRAVSSD